MLSVRIVDGETTFIEVQQFRQRWLWLVVLGMLALVVGLFGYGMFSQLMKNQPWGDRPMSDEALVVVAGVSIAFSLGLPLLLRFARLEVKVAPRALEINFRPFAARRILYADIVSVEAKTYRPLRDYGGYGVRWAPSRGVAYNVSGNQGVLLRLSDGKQILIGSRNAEGLADAIGQKAGASRGPAGVSESY